MKKRITLERTYPGRVDQVWQLWTTKDGIESWWGPEGFRVEVHAIDVRPGGEVRYTMVAVAPEMIDFMKKNGMPVSRAHKLTYREVVPYARLAYVQVADFIPEVTPYDVHTDVELEEVEGGRVKMRVIIDPMHDQLWTDRFAAGMNQELDKLGKVLSR